MCYRKKELFKAINSADGLIPATHETYADFEEKLIKAGINLDKLSK